MSDKGEEPEMKKRKLSSPGHRNNGSQVEEVVMDSDLRLVDFAECRAREVVAMSRISQAVSGKKRTQQLIPWHMRRRTASHNVKRLPRRLREAAKRQMQVNPPVKNKRPSRKQRRRPSNLLEEYARRKAKVRWLETHIWHAKRFHMVKKWGYKIANYPNDKGVRALFRAAQKHCLLQDISFLTCIEIRGVQNDIVVNLNRMACKEVGPRFGAAAYVKGQREGSTVMYEADMYPYSAIGPVQFMWKPNINDKVCEEAVLWIWAHPSIVSRLLENILKVLDIEDSVDVNANKKRKTGASSHTEHICMEGEVKAKVPGEMKRPERKKDADDEEMICSAKKGASDEQIIHDGSKSIGDGLVSSEFANSEFRVKLLIDELRRFSLKGPLSQIVLAGTLKPANINNVNLTEVKGECLNYPTDRKYWWKKYYSQDSMSNNHEDQSNTWRHLSSALSPGELVPYCILGLTVTDPRLSLPIKKGKTYPDIEDWNSKESSDQEVCQQVGPPWLPLMSYSPLWEAEIRKVVMETKESEEHINNLRSKNLVPGQLDLADNASRVPVILIQNPGNRSLRGSTEDAPKGLGCGWDIVLPARWSMAFWVSFVYRGARVCGLRDSSLLSQSQGVLQFPSHYPDTEAGRLHCQYIKAEKMMTERKKPASKKANYLKYGIAAPFDQPWIELLANWRKDQSNNSFPVEDKCYVLRSKRKLRELGALCDSELSHDMIAVDRVFQGIMHENCLVPVEVKMMNKGTPKSMSIICIPTNEDVQNVCMGTDCKALLETRHKVPKVSLKANTIREKKELKKRKEEKGQEMQRKLLTNIRWSCSRQIGGFVCSGGFGLPSGCGSGVGFITLEALKTLLSLKDYQKKNNSGSKLTGKRTIVLVRNTTSLAYRYGYLNIFESTIKLC